MEFAGGGEMKMRVLDLFSGIGGFSLGLERTGGFETVAFCEINPFCRQVLRKHWPGIECFKDINFLPYYECDVITAGFPCQPYSTASHGQSVMPCLWPRVLDAVYRMKPKIVIAENVKGKVVQDATEDLRGLGYKQTTIRLGANEAGADHQRNRWWSCTYPNDEGEFHRAVDAEMAKLQAFRGCVWGWENYARAIRVSDGLPNRMDRITALGNTVIPYIVTAIGRAYRECAA